jgi:hypothetical protein
MKCRNLINLVDKFNEHNIIASLTLNPENIVFIYENYDEQIKELENISNYLESKLPNTVISRALIDKGKYKNVHKIISKYDSKETLLNISGGSKIMSLISYEATKNLQMKSIFVDVDDEKIFIVNDDGIEELDVGLKNLGVKDFIDSTGGEIIYDSTGLGNNKKIQKYVKYIIENFDIWDDLKRILKDPKIVIHDKIILDAITVNLYSIDEYHRKRFQGFFDKLRELDLINIAYLSPSELDIKFKTLEAKTILFKTGTWLEVLVYNLIKQIKHVSDVKSGVVFLWDDDIRYVKNEVDVVASANSQLIYVSCKDTEKYDENTLNELQVYAGQLGGGEVKKILVATKESEKRSLKLRAEEMGIYVLIFNGDVEELRKKLSNIIIG